jgi:hypothetical protein
MNDRPDDPDIPLAPFPTEIRRSPFPPLDGETAPTSMPPNPPRLRLRRRVRRSLGSPKVLAMPLPVLCPTTHW